MLYRVIDQKPDRMEKIMDQYNGYIDPSLFPFDPGFDQ